MGITSHCRLETADGPPVSIPHFHGSRLSVGSVGSGDVMEISAARDKVALNCFF